MPFYGRQTLLRTNPSNTPSTLNRATELDARRLVQAHRRLEHRSFGDVNLVSLVPCQPSGLSIRMARTRRIGQMPYRHVKQRYRALSE